MDTVHGARRVWAPAARMPLAPPAMCVRAFRASGQRGSSTTILSPSPWQPALPHRPGLHIVRTHARSLLPCPPSLSRTATAPGHRPLGSARCGGGGCPATASARTSTGQLALGRASGPCCWPPVTWPAPRRSAPRPHPDTATEPRREQTTAIVLLDIMSGGHQLPHEGHPQRPARPGDEDPQPPPARPSLSVGLPAPASMPQARQGRSGGCRSSPAPRSSPHRCRRGWLIAWNPYQSAPSQSSDACHAGRTIEIASATPWPAEGRRPRRHRRSGSSRSRSGRSG